MSFLRPKPYDLSELVDMAAQMRIGLDPDPPQGALDGAALVGRVLVREVQPGLFATGYDVDCLTDVTLSEAVEPCVMCGVHLYGVNEPMTVEGYGPVTFKPGHAVVLGLGVACQCESRPTAGRRRSFVGCTIKPEFFDRLLGGRQDESLCRLARMMESGISITSVPCSPELADIAERTLNNPYDGILADLYQESCTLAQVAEISRLVEEGAGHRPAPALSRRQHDRVHRAREILDQRIGDPPSMQDLSKQVGINATSLRAEFQQAYGISVFSYVREQRLQLARALLKTEDLPVSTVGYRVGFGNPGAFATAYRRRFGLAPSQEQSAFQHHSRVGH